MIGADSFVTCPEVLCRNPQGGTEEYQKNLRQNSRQLGRDFIQVLPGFKSTVFPLHQASRHAEK
jgi:hypothetical protein